MDQPHQKKKPKEDLSERIIFGIARIYKWWSRIILMNENEGSMGVINFETIESEL